MLDNTGKFNLLTTIHSLLFLLEWYTNKDTLSNFATSLPKDIAFRPYTTISQQVNFGLNKTKIYFLSIFIGEG